MALKIFSKDTVTVQYAWETPFLCVGDSVAIMSWKGGQRHAEKYKVQSKQIIKPSLAGGAASRSVWAIEVGGVFRP